MTITQNNSQVLTIFTL